MKKQLNMLAAWRRQPWISQLLRSYAKAEIFIVGGAVRDALLGRPTTDFDFVVRGVAKKPLEQFLAKRGGVNLVGKKFGVFKFKPRGWTGAELDIALPRTEHSLHHSGAYRDFKISSSAALKIEDDLSRRDFTINAMAWDIKNQTLIDPFDGVSDLKKQVIKTVGKPHDRFAEDYSRMLRAVRFACQLDFDIDPKTWAAIKKLINRITKTVGGTRIVPDEVIAKELIKAVTRQPVLAVTLLDECGAVKQLLPELLKMKKCPQPEHWHSEGDVWQHTLLALSILDSAVFKKEFSRQMPSAEVIWGLLYHDVGKPFTIIKTDRLRFNGHDMASVKKFHDTAERLKLASAGLNVSTVEKIIAKHMLLASMKMSGVKNTTLEKYFFNSLFPGTELLMLMFADVSASLSPTGRPHLVNYRQLKKRLRTLHAANQKKKTLVKPLISGHDVLRVTKVKPGPIVGEILDSVREAQLSHRIQSRSDAIRLMSAVAKKIKKMNAD